MNSLAQWIDYGVAKRVRPGEHQSGDCHVVVFDEHQILLAVIDGIGHGEEAATAANAAVVTLENFHGESVTKLMRRCHENLRATRGVVLSIASIDTTRGLMSWLGVGNVQAFLFRGPVLGGGQEVLLLRSGVVGSSLPSLQESEVPIRAGDTLVLFTDGMRPDLTRDLPLSERPQRAANAIVEKYHNGNDDALVLIARFKGTPA